MSISKEKLRTLKVSNSKSELLVNKFYDLRKALEANYSGSLRSYKYEETREFTIALNHAIFRANQIVSDNNISFKSTANLEGVLKILRQDLLLLKG